MDQLEVLLERWAKAYNEYKELSKKHQRYERALDSLKESPEFYKEIGLNTRGFNKIKSDAKVLTAETGVRMSMAREEWISRESEIKNRYKDFIHRLFITAESDGNVHAYAPNTIVLVGDYKEVIKILAPTLFMQKEKELGTELYKESITGRKEDYLKGNINIRRTFYEQPSEGLTLVTFGVLDDVKTGILRYVEAKSQKQLESGAAIHAF